MMVNNLQFWGRTRNFCWKFWVSGISSSTSQFFEPFEDTTDSPFIQKEQRFKKWWELWAHFFWKWRVLTLRSKKWLKKFIVQKKWKFAHLKFNSSLLKSYRILKGKDHLPTKIFQGRAAKLRGCTNSEQNPKLQKSPKRHPRWPYPQHPLMDLWNLRGVCEEARNQHFGWFSVLILWADFC